MINKGKKSLVLILFGLMLICAGVGTLIAYAYNPGDPFNIIGGKYSVNVDEAKTADIKDVDEISVNVSSADINIIPEDREDVKAVLSGYIKSSSEVAKPELTVDKSSNKLSIGIKGQNSFWGFVNISLKMDVYIPKSYSKDLSLDSSSGEMNLTEKLTLNNLICSLSSGDLTIKDTTCNKFSYDCSSGSMKADILKTQETKLDSSSGDITIKSFTGNVEGESSSGEISIAYSEFNNNVNLTARSGEINIKLPKNSEFYLDANCSSGEVDCDFPVTISGKKKDNTLTGTVVSDKNKIKLNTSSGDINVKYQ
ncbi:MAG: DUF4097 family beta strand repeat-containing protein [Bacillota bacterium]|nr:DUF4097 family beta strand repeat-containing protein [Bacillota bacterium]